MGAKIITDPRNGIAPAGTIVSSLRALQRMGAKTWSGRCLDSLHAALTDSESVSGRRGHAPGLQYDKQPVESKTH